MHPKNSTVTPLTQVSRDACLLVTSVSEFGPVVGGSLFSVLAGLSCGDAMNAASTNLSSAEALLGDLVADSDSVHHAYAIRTLVREAKALIDSSVVAVERAEDQR